MCSAVPSNQPSPRPLFVASAAFVGIFFATFLLVIAFAFCCRRRRSARTGPEFRGDPSGGCGGGAFPVESLPAFAYGRDADGGGAAVAAASAAGGRECAVCLGAVQDGEMVRRLPACMHVYHVECIDRWLAAHRTCPLCRLELHPCKVAPAMQPTPQEADPPDELPV